jgi:hypothetical protein
MDLSPEERQALDDLREVARRYCAEIEAVSQRTPIEFLRRMNQLLPELYWRASLLPEVDPWADEDDDSEPDDDAESAAADFKPDSADANGMDRFSAQRLLQALLGPLDVYRMVYDPFNDDTSITYVLSDDLASIYAAVRERLDHPDADETKRLWDWRSDFTSYWGSDLVPSALHATSWLLYKHWAEDEKRWHDEFLSRRNPGQT